MQAGRWVWYVWFEFWEIYIFFPPSLKTRESEAGDHLQVYDKFAASGKLC
jgi:hypothetical protein